MDGSAAEEVEVKEVDQVEVTEAEETGGASYLATTVASKDISPAISELKEVVSMVRDTMTWILTTQQRTSPALTTKPYVPSRENAPRERTLPDGTNVKLCSKCGSWGNHFRSGHPAPEDQPPDDEGDVDTANVGMQDEGVESNGGSLIEEDKSGAFSCLRRAGLI